MLLKLHNAFSLWYSFSWWKLDKLRASDLSLILLQCECQFKELNHNARDLQKKPAKRWKNGKGGNGKRVAQEKSKASQLLILSLTSILIPPNKVHADSWNFAKVKCRIGEHTHTHRNTHTHAHVRTLERSIKLYTREQQKGKTERRTGQNPLESNF